MFSRYDGARHGKHALHDGRGLLTSSSLPPEVMSTTYYFFANT